VSQVQRRFTSMSLRIRFWGTRGSIPSPGPRTVRYGGNTPCVELRTSSDELVVLDAGTGIRELGRALLEGANGKPLDVDLFLTHTHWDHIQGLPFFEPAFRAGHRITLWIAGPPLDALEHALREQMAPVVFPVHFDQLPATVRFRRLGGATPPGRTYAVDAKEVRHPGGALAYRFRDHGDNAVPSLVYVSDNELPGDDEGTRAEHDALVEFVRGARVLVHDATYTDAEYASRRGWGHSTDTAALRLAIEAGVRTLVLFHHAPERSDAEIDAMLARCRRAAAGRVEVLAAAEGMEIEIEG
jgi:phosphoribosyl 1,2-cyclic phosphodiesterase